MSEVQLFRIVKKTNTALKQPMHFDRSVRVTVRPMLSLGTFLASTSEFCTKTFPPFQTLITHHGLDHKYENQM
jgi:hypothetical protein